jgi:hypothetical protein
MVLLLTCNGVCWYQETTKQPEVIAPSSLPSESVIQLLSCNRLHGSVSFNLNFWVQKCWLQPDSAWILSTCQLGTEDLETTDWTAMLMMRKEWTMLAELFAQSDPVHMMPVAETGVVNQDCRSK